MIFYNLFSNKYLIFIAGIIFFIVISIIPIATCADLDTPFNTPQYLVHITETSTMYGPLEKDVYIIYPVAPEDGTLLTADGYGGYFINKAELVGGRFNTPQEVCNAAKGLPAEKLSLGFSCAVAVEETPAEEEERTDEENRSSLFPQSKGPSSNTAAETAFITSILILIWTLLNRPLGNGTGLSSGTEALKPEIAAEPDRYDADGFDKDGYNKDGFDREGYDKDGYDKNGYNKKGYDRDGYNKSGFDPWGFNKQGVNWDGKTRGEVMQDLLERQKRREKISSGWGGWLGDFLGEFGRGAGRDIASLPDYVYDKSGDLVKGTQKVAKAVYEETTDRKNWEALGEATSQTIKDLFGKPGESLSKMGRFYGDIAEYGKNIVKGIYKDPVTFIKTILGIDNWEKVVDGNIPFGERVARALYGAVDSTLTLAGGGAKIAQLADKVSDAAKAVKGLDVAGDLAKGAKALDAAGDMGKGAKAVDAAGDMGKGAKAADAAGDMGKGAKAADAAGDTGKGAKAADAAGDGAKSTQAVDTVKKSRRSPNVLEKQRAATKKLAQKKLEEIRKAASQGDKRAQKILSKWEKSAERGRLGPAARGKTAMGGTKDWEMTTRQAIKTDPKTPKHVKGWYTKQDVDVKKRLMDRATSGDKTAKKILDNPDRLKDYLARRNTEPPGYQLGHQLGDKLGDKAGRLENIDMNVGKGRRTGL